MTEPAPPARKSIPGLARVAGDEPFSVLDTMGGVRGLIESALPALVFSVSYGLTRDVRPCAYAAVAVAVLILVVRLVGRKPLLPAISGFLGVLIAAWWATHTGRASNFFLLSILRNGLFAALYVITVAVGWPLLGIMLGQLFGEGFAWRKVPPRLRVYSLATLLWAAMFALRLAIQLPLFLADKVTALGLVAVPLGLPLFALVLLGTWMIIRSVPVVVVEEEHGDEAVVEPSEEGTAEHDHGARHHPDLEALAEELLRELVDETAATAALESPGEPDGHLHHHRPGRPDGPATGAGPG